MLKKFKKIKSIRTVVEKVRIYFKWIFDRSNINILEALPLYIPCSAGKYKDRSDLTLECANLIFPSLIGLSNNVLLKSSHIDSIDKYITESDKYSMISQAFRKYGSDKSTTHNYDIIYKFILQNGGDIASVLEIGMGTNNKNVVSTMCGLGNPGGSLRAFAELLPNTQIYGADIDKDILFRTDQIETFFVDQTSTNSMLVLSSKIDQDLSLVIDDGLHSPYANINTISTFFPRLINNGWIVIEDIGYHAKDFWVFVANIMPPNAKCQLIEARGAFVFAIQKTSN